jgi:cytoskeletal protein CcmA (bactofilin family)
VKNTAKEFSIIDNDLTVEGILSSKGKLVVKGTVRGQLDGETVIIAKEGAVYAETKVSSMTVAGIFEGNVKASEELVILSTGKCSGRVVCKDLVIEAKGILNAQVSCISQETSEIEEALSASIET